MEGCSYRLVQRIVLEYYSANGLEIKGKNKFDGHN